MDHGNIDLVMKTSTDNGNSWSSLKIIWNDGNNTCGNPTPVQDRLTGDILLIATLNNDKIFLLRSHDEGMNWEKPVDITSTVKPENWKWYASGPVHAIQLQQGRYKNRIVVPCNHTLAGIDKHISHVIYSDDHGLSWQLGGSASLVKTDECTVVELSDYTLLLNMRNSDRSLPNRKTSISNDGGLSWSIPKFDSTLIEPVCQGSLLRYSYSPSLLLFANPKHETKRQNLTLSISKDDGKTWTRQITIHAKKAAYNDLTLLHNGNILCVFETGKILPYSGICATTIQQSAITEQ